MRTGRKKQNRMAKLCVTSMVFLLIVLMSAQITRLYRKNQELAVKEAAYEAQKTEEEARRQQLEEQEKSLGSQDYIEQEAHRYGLFYDDEIIFREKE